MDAAVSLCIPRTVFLFVLYNLSLPLAPMFLGLIFTSILPFWLPKAGMVLAAVSEELGGADGRVALPALALGVAQGQLS